MNDNYYRVEVEDENAGCKHCGHGKFWVIMEGQGDDAAGQGTSYGDKETADDICDLMNMAFDAGAEKYKQQFVNEIAGAVTSASSAGEKDG